MINRLKIITVVVTYNRPKELPEVIQALQLQSYKTDILVIDNASEISATSILKLFKGVEIVRNSVNTGGAGGFAEGVRFAAQGRADWIWLMDDDAVPETTALERLVETIPSLPKRTGALCSEVIEHGKVAYYHRRTFGENIGSENVIIPTDKITRIDTGSFVGFLVNRQAVDEVGLPLAYFFIAYDDTEYSLRLGRFGWSLWLISMSKINHMCAPESSLGKQHFSRKHYYNIRNRFYVARKYCKYPLLASICTFFHSLRVLRNTKGRLKFRSLSSYYAAVQAGMSNTVL